MPRVPRFVLPDGAFHVTTRGVNGEDIYGDDNDRRLFVFLLKRTMVRYHWECHAYCLMTTHYHLLISCSRENLSNGLRALNGVYAQRFNKRYDRRGHLFGGRFWATVVDADLLPVTRRYVLLNPVRAGACDVPEDWPWSWSPCGTEI